MTVPPTSGCPSGFTQCSDGTCVASEELCFQPVSSTDLMVSETTIPDKITILTTVMVTTTPDKVTIPTTMMETTTPTKMMFSESTILNTVTDVSTEVATTPTVCPDGFVLCGDRTCEPYAALCGESGIVTVVFPTEITTPQQANSINPVVTGASIDGQEICLDGWELCKDGTCEPFHWLCTEHDGSAHFTKVTGHTYVTTTVPIVSTAQPFTSLFAQPEQTTVMPEQFSLETLPPGACPSGFVLCVEGNCEPFEALCGGGGIVTVTFPTGETSEPVTATTSRSLEGTAGMTEFVSTSTMSSVRVTQSTTPFHVVTDQSGHEVCLDGWELCKDGTCEPFHWLCTEHDVNGGIIIG